MTAPIPCTRGHELNGMKRCAICEGERNRSINDRLRDKIIDVKARMESAHEPEDERRMLRELNAAGHPDPMSLITAIKTRLESKGRRR